MTTSVPAGSSSTNRSNCRRVSRLPFDDPPGSIRERHFEHVLCQIHGDRRSIHLGLLLVAWLRPTIHGNDAAKEPGGVHAITEKVSNLKLEEKT